MTQIYVKNDSELKAAITNAKDGDSILLAPGTYAPVVIRLVNKDITLTSADPDNRAVMTGVTMRESSGVSFSALDFEAPAGKLHSFTFASSKNFTIDDITLRGPDNMGSGQEVSPFIIRDSQNFSVTNSEFSHVKHGLELLDVQNGLIDGNYFHDIRTDGVRGGGISNTQISNNRFTDFYPIGDDHPDAVQIWSTNQTEIARNIVITGNVVVRGNGDPIQGIFVADTYSQLPYDNVTITNNVILGGAWNGVSLLGASNSTVSGNIVAGYDDQGSFLRVEAVTNTAVNDNLSTRYVFGAKDSPYLATNTYIPEKGQAYNSLITPGDAATLLSLSSADLAQALTKLLGITPSDPAPQTPDPVVVVPEAPVITLPEAPVKQAIVVSNDAELKAAVKKAVAGDVIYLKEGEYSAVVLRSVEANLTLTSFDQDRPATLTGLTVNKADGLTLSHLAFKAAAGSLNSFAISESDGLTLHGLTVTGLGAVGSGKEASPLIIRQSSNVKVTDSEFSTLKNALQLLDVTGAVVSGNSFSDIVGNAIFGAGASHTQITGNSFTDFRGINGTSAAVNFWTSNQKAATQSLSVTDNLITRGDGQMMQGIVIRDAGSKLAYQDLTVTGNAVIGGVLNGISLENFIGGTVTGNLVTGYAGERSQIRIAKDSDSVIADNTANFYLFSSTTSPLHAANTKLPEKGIDYSKIAYTNLGDNPVAGLLSQIQTQLQPPAHAENPVPAPNPEPVYKLFQGTAGNDGFNGTAGDDKMLGEGGDDTLYGRAGHDYLDGGAGNDIIEAGDGNDIVFGGAGDDRLSGGPGNDILTGGSGADTFLFRDGDLGAGSYDIITDYERGIDKPIHLRGVDANTNTAVDDNFTFIGTGAFTKTAGQLKYSLSDGGALVQGDLNGDGVADFSILLLGHTHVQASDFWL